MVIPQQVIHTINLGFRAITPIEVLVGAALGLSDEAPGKAGFVAVTEPKIVEEVALNDEVGEAGGEAGI